MGKAILTLLTILVALSLAVSASAYKKNSFEFHPVALAMSAYGFGLIQVKYERSLEEHISPFVEFGWGGFSPYSPFIKGDENYDWSELFFGGGINLYPKGDNRGPYVSLDMEYYRFKASSTTTSAETTSNVFFPAGLVGWKWIAGDFLVIRLGVGGGYLTANLKDAGGTELKGSGAWLATELTVGVAF